MKKIALFDWILALLFLFAVAIFLSQTVHGYELLVLNRTDLPAKTNWEKYDIVDVEPDGWKWGTEELNKDKFLIIKVPNDTKDIGKFLNSDEVNDKARIYKVNIGSMTTMEKTNFADNKLTLTKTKASVLITSKTVTADK